MKKKPTQKVWFEIFYKKKIKNFGKKKKKQKK